MLTPEGQLATKFVDFKPVPQDPISGEHADKVIPREDMEQREAWIAMSERSGYAPEIHEENLRPITIQAAAYISFLNQYGELLVKFNHGEPAR